MKLTASDAAALVGRHQAEVWRYLIALGCPRADAEDVAQETFLALFRSEFEQRAEYATRAWLRTTARHLFIDQCRKRRREAPMEEIEAVEAAWNDEVGQDGGAQQVAILRRCLEALQGRTRKAVDLRYSQGMNYAECGRAIGADEEATKSLIRRAREKLRECMESKLKEARP